MTDDASVGELLSLIDRLGAMLDESALSELEVEVGATTLILRKRSALAGPWAVASAAADLSTAGVASPGRGGRSAGGDRTAADRTATSSRGEEAPPPADPAPGEPPNALHAVIAPLTGVFYVAPSPGAAPYVRIGGPVAQGQVIGLIEAMKLFNEIKSDIGGIVRRIAAESGALVRAKQPLIEVEPG